MFTRVWGVLLAFRYVFTNLVKYRYAEGHVFAAAAPKGGVFSEPIQGNSSRRNRLVKAKSPKGGVFSEPVQGNSSRQNTPLQGEIAWRPSRQNRLAPIKAKSPGALQGEIAWRPCVGVSCSARTASMSTLGPHLGSMQLTAARAYRRSPCGRTFSQRQPARTVAHAINSGRAWGCRVRLELRA